MTTRLARLKMETAVTDDEARWRPCKAMSPGGWHCCLPLGHPGNHIGCTASYGSLYQWAPEEES